MPPADLLPPAEDDRGQTVPLVAHGEAWLETASRVMGPARLPIWPSYLARGLGAPSHLPPAPYRSSPSPSAPKVH